MKIFPVTPIIGPMPHRLALAGGWIDQPFISKHNPHPPGSMVVVQIEPNFMPMERSGFAGSTRDTAAKLWPKGLPQQLPHRLVRTLYAAENASKKAPSGSQDMVGILYPGINRLDYDYSVEGGVFPKLIHPLTARNNIRWLEQVLHVIPVAPRPPGYNPLEEKNLDPQWIAKLGKTGRDCFAAICDMDMLRLGRSFNDCMECWEAILPGTVKHRTIKIDLKTILKVYQDHYPGAMYSGCGGGYLFVVSDKPVLGAFTVLIRTKD